MFQRPQAPLLLFPLFLLGACNGSAGGPASVGPTLQNDGLVSQPGELSGEQELWLVAAREFEAGGRDLNGDGDAFDQVAFVTDLASGTTRNTALALSPAAGALSFAVGERLAAFAASELSSGRGDLNGDGDTADDVLHVHDAATATTRNLGLALPLGSRPVVEGDVVAFLVSEAAQGNRDLDGDGSTAGAVLFTYEALTRKLTRTLIAPDSELFLHRGLVAYLAEEAGVDQNGDGDGLDLVLRTFDPSTGVDSSAGLASDGSAPLAADGTWLLAVPERDQGGLDANGDGDAEDTILHVVDPLTLHVRSLRVECPPDRRFASRPESGRESFALLVTEEDGADRNLDGDLDDLVPLTYDPRLDLLTNTRVASAGFVVFAGDFVGFLGLEAAQGIDLDGDGDLEDAVAFLADPGTEQVTNLEQDALDLRGSEDFLLLARAEARAGEDWNRDGDVTDVVVHAYALGSALTTNTAIASLDVFGATADEILLYVDEAGERSDLNGDGDRVDQVFVRFELAGARNVSLRLAGGTEEAGFASLAPSGALVLLADERAQGVDLNGDGDRFDQILHRSR